MKIENIKFKAKRLDNGEWVIGDLFHEPHGVVCIVQHTDDTDRFVTVDPSTVCQFTGLKDRKGNEIWEGDRMKNTFFETEVIVEWDDSLCGYKCVDCIVNINYSLISLVELSGWYVIGNKFDKEK